MSITFDQRAKWIWLASQTHDKNVFGCLRRTFVVEEGVGESELRITADSRYDAYLNGVWLGHGPVRSWPSPWPVDTYDVKHLLRAGENVLSVLVHHFGISTFQYLHDEPGLLAELEVDGETIVTDGQWRCVMHEGYQWPVPRISCMQGWEEQFDARVAPGAPEEWTAVGFDDSSWELARATRRAGEPPHESFEPKRIPDLTRQVVEPVAVRAIEVVKSAPYQFFLNPRDYINPQDKSANHIRSRVLLATVIHSDRAQQIEVHPPHDRPNVKWKLNGKLLEFSDRSLQATGTGVAHARLKKGANVLMGKLPEMEHYVWAVLNLWPREPVKFDPWVCVGPFSGGASEHVFDRILVEPIDVDPAATAERHDAIWSRGMLNENDHKQKFVRKMEPHMVATQDVYARCASERALPKELPLRVAWVDALRTDNSEWTTVDPEQGDVRFLLDFGNETVGNHEFEIAAPAGTIVDFHNFEFIQRDGRINLCEGMNNSFRYVCREGVQKYRTFWRRGFRYSWMTLRNFSRPVSIRFVRVIQSTYPIGPAGSFECSDTLLTEIWKAGVQSVRCCAEDTFTDCPTYEQTLWVGDARNEALVHLVADGDSLLSARSLRLAGRSLDRSPIVESQVPSGWQNLLPTWSFLWMRWAQEHYELTGSKHFAREMLEYLERNNGGIEENLNESGLFQMHAWNLFDWAGMDTPAKGIVTHINCQAVHGLRQAAELAVSLKRQDLARRWTKLADGIAAAVNKHLWSAKRNAYLDCIRADGKPSTVFSQQTQTAAYLSGVAKGARSKRCLAIIDRPPKGFVTAGSPFFMFFLLEALVREERFNQLIETIRSYWGAQIEAGATTFWEMYHPKNERLTRSHCHGWSAAPVVFLTQHVLGVRPLEPGYRKVLIAPRFGDLKWAQGRVPTPHGDVEVYWQRLGKTEFAVEVTSPVEARIELPVRGTVKIESGKGRVAGAMIVAQPGRTRIRVKAGR